MRGMVGDLSREALRVEGTHVEADGLLHCDLCGGARQTVVPDPLTGAALKLGCVCRCMVEAEERREREEAEATEASRREAARRRSFDGAEYLTATFASDDGTDPRHAATCRNYSANFEAFLAKGVGLLLYGRPGTGKSFYGACIANALVDAGRTVRMTNFTSLVGSVQREAFRRDVVGELSSIDLLVIDDLGVERSTEFMQEQVYSIVDARYRSKLPMVVTTNLGLTELTAPSGVVTQRVYGRILERCVPVLFDGPDRRMAGVTDAGLISMLREKF